ncbi:MAG: hypothetical protein KC468_24870 [Myxococcales bacterium]|nr:hypothetical protein [Myxococcales bacterium]
MAVLAGHNAHYSIRKAARLIGGGALRVERVPIDERFRVDARALASRLESLARERVEVLAVVTTAGTTATGSVDPMAEVAALQRERGFWWHVDAAYGGHFCASLFRADTSSPDERDLLGFPRARPSRDPAPDSSLPAHSLRALRAARHATSISIDPHKLGFVAKGCGALLLADPAWMSLLGEEAGYFRDEVPGVLPLGRQHSVASGLEGSRSGRAPISCYVTHRALPLHQGGLGALLERGVELAQRACRAMQALTVNGWRVRPLHEPDTNIVCAVVTRDGQRVEDCSRCAAAFVDALRAVGAPMCSLTVFRREEAPPLFDALLPALGVRVSSSSREVAALRFVFANPELSDAWPRDFTRVAAGALEEMTP